MHDGWHIRPVPLFEMTPGSLVAVPTTTSAAEQVLERADLQRPVDLAPTNGSAFEPGEAE